MEHPIVSNRKSLAVYFIIWLMMAILQGLFLYNFFEAGAVRAVADAFIYTLYFSILGLGLWYAVRFSQMETKSLYQLLIHHVSAMALTLVIWLAMGYYSVLWLPFIDAGYGDFFQNTMISRVLFGTLLYVLIVLVYYLIMYYQNFREKITRESALETSMKNAELANLRSQINPHFLFNSLNSISALTIEEPEKAREMVHKLSDFLRDSISESYDKRRHFGEEIKHIAHYLDIEKIRFGKKLQVDLDVAKKCKEAVIPHMILQPLVENAIKHGVGESTEQVRIKIIADCFHGFLKVQVENNYDPEFRSRKGVGIGMDNIRKRIELMYNREDLMSVSNDNNMFRVTLNFPQNGSQ